MGCFGLQRQAEQMAGLWVYAVCLVLSVIKLRLICSLKWRRTRTLQYSYPLKSCLCIFFRLLSSSLFLFSFLYISFYLIFYLILFRLLSLYLTSFLLVFYPSHLLIPLSSLSHYSTPSSQPLLTFSIPLLTSHYILPTFGHLLPLIYFILTFPVISPLLSHFFFTSSHLLCSYIVYFHPSFHIFS